MGEMQVIRGISFPDKKGQMPGIRKYCLLDLFKTQSGFMISKINLDGTWYFFKIAKEFKDQKEAEKYAKENKIKLAYSAEVML